MRSMPLSRRTLASRSSTTRILAFRMSVGLTIDLCPDSYGERGPLSSEFQGDIQRLHELIDLDWLGEIPEEPGLQTLLDVARHGVGAEGHHRDVRRGRVLAKNSQGFDAADARQVDVHQDHLRQVGAGQL